MIEIAGIKFPIGGNFKRHYLPSEEISEEVKILVRSRKPQTNDQLDLTYPRRTTNVRRGYSYRGEAINSDEARLHEVVRILGIRSVPS